MKLFTNWTKDDFTYTFNNIPYTFKANSSTELDDGVADHFALHLANRELNNAGLPTDCPQLQDFVNNCFGSYKEPVIEHEVTAEEIKDNGLEEVLKPGDKIEIPVKEEKVIKKIIKKKKVKNTVKKAERVANF